MRSDKCEVGNSAANDTTKDLIYANERWKGVK